MNTASLTLGAINLLGDREDMGDNGWVVEATAEGADFGNPTAVDREVDSWLQDGVIVSRDKYGNRSDMVLKVRLTGVDANMLALAEMALVAEVGRPNLLTWTPPGVDAAACVFSLVMSTLDHAFDDMAELRERPERTFLIRMQAEPFVSAVDMVSVTKPAPTGTQVITSIDDGSSTTNWTGTAAGATTTALSTVSGTLIWRASGYTTPWGNKQLRLKRTGLAASLATTPFVRVQAQFTTAPAISVGPVFLLNGVSVPVAMQVGNYFWLDTTGTGVGTTLTTFEIRASWGIYTPGVEISIRLLDLSRSNVIGEDGTNRQLTRTLDVAGSMRTPASLAVEDETNALGTVLVYTSPSVAGIAQPNLRQFRVGGASTSVGTNVSGFSSDLGTLHSFDVPITQLCPGGYVLMARVSDTAGAKSLTWAAKSRQGSTSLADGQAGTTPFTATGSYQVVQVARMNLPPRKLGPDGVVRIELSGTSTLDEAWLFNIDTGRLTWVECGTVGPAAGGSSNRLWLDSPTLESPSPAVYRGFAADRSDSMHVGSEMLSLGNHEFVPPAMNIFTVTTNSQASAVTLSSYPRFHSHVAA